MTQNRRALVFHTGMPVLKQESSIWRMCVAAGEEGLGPQMGDNRLRPLDKGLSVCQVHAGDDRLR